MKKSAKILLTIGEGLATITAGVTILDILLTHISAEGLGTQDLITGLACGLSPKEASEGAHKEVKDFYKTSRTRIIRNAIIGDSIAYTLAAAAIIIEKKGK